jgi:hypothetical protein
MVDVAVSRMMGLVVVARLANRHGVKVELRPSDSERGTVADVGLPSAVLVVSSMANRVQQPGLSNFPAAEQQSRPSFPEPLALESGRGGYPGGRPFDPNPPMPSGGMLGTGAGRSVPSWSDLTGAPGNGGFTNGGFSNGGFPDGVNGSNGGNGANGFHGPRSTEVIPPLPQGPQDFGGDDGLPQRRNGEAYRPDGGTGFGGGNPRQLPGHQESQTRSPFVPPPVSASPRRRRTVVAARSRRRRSPVLRSPRRRFPRLRRTPRRPLGRRCRNGTRPACRRAWPPRST